MEARSKSRDCALTTFCTILSFAIVLGTWTQFDSGTAHAQMRRQLRQSRVVTKNFVVTAPDQNFAQKVADEAERFRKELSVEWLGYEIKPWSERCPIVVRFENGAGGRTSFAFYRNGQTSIPREWDMEIFGPPERILDSVLPHEVTHTIFATHFGRPLPRWADEGACTTVEHESERKRNHEMLIDILSARPSRGIPFNRMYTLRDYPEDIFPLYAQGYSLARFLLGHKNKKDFIRYIETGLAYEDKRMGLAGWDRATQEIYGYEDLSELQIGWQNWVRKGSPRLDIADTRQNETLGNNQTFVASSNPVESVETPAPPSDGFYASHMQQVEAPQATSANMPSTSLQPSGYNAFAEKIAKTASDEPDQTILSVDIDSPLAMGVPKAESGPTQNAFNAADIAYRPGSIGRNQNAIQQSTFVSIGPANRTAGLDRVTNSGSGVGNPPQFRPPTVQSQVPGQYRSRPTILR